jgi:N-acetylglucosamine-6-phosphate deacetylase
MACTCLGGSELRLVITGGLVVTPLDLLDDCDVVIEDGLIAGVGPGLAAHVADETIDARGRINAPGFIDIHVHGSAGHDTMDGTAEAIEGMARFFASHGVTSFCPTTMTMPAEDIMRR